MIPDADAGSSGGVPSVTGRAGTAAARRIPGDTPRPAAVTARRVRRAGACAAAFV